MSNNLVLSQPINASNLVLNRSLAHTEKPIIEAKPQSKQLNYYYNHIKDRLDYAKAYYTKHKTSILTAKRNHYNTLKVKRTKETITVIQHIIERTYTNLKHELNECLSVHDSVGAQEIQEVMKECLAHEHGAPKGFKPHQKHLYFHLLPQLNWHPLFKTVELNPIVKKDMAISAKTLAAQIRHFLGLKLGDSFVWKETNRLGKTETHILYFDGSGLDMSHKGDLERLVNYSIESGLKGQELLCMFAGKYSVDGYIQLFRGNKLLITSDPERALKTYIKYNIGIGRFD